MLRAAKLRFAGMLPVPRALELLPLLMFAAFWPVWRWYVLRMTDGSDEPWGMLALLAGVAFLWRVRSEIQIGRHGIIVALSAMALYVLLYPFMPALIRAGVALTALAAVTGTLRRHPAIWGLFALSLPVIATMQFYLGYPLRIIAAVFAEGMLKGLGQAVARQGTELLWNGQIVGVDAPCSGVKMLWTGLFLAMAMCALHRTRWIPTLSCLAGATILIVLGNSLRATVLFAKESGMVALPDWTHQGIGLLIFGGMIFGFSRFMKPTEEAVALSEARIPRYAGPIALVICVSVMLAPFRAAASEGGASTSFPGWPRLWQGHALEPLPLTAQEKSFAGSFPGRLGVFSAGPHKVILRWVTRPTRKLHSSADCLRASGYEITTERPGRFIAEGPAGRFVVQESICEDKAGEGRSWKEVSAWFWSAAFARTSGPWWAMTVISPSAYE